MRDAPEKPSRAEAAATKAVLAALVNLHAEQTFSPPAFDDLRGHEIAYA